MHRIEAELMIPGRGEPVHDGVVIIDGPAISYAGPLAEIKVLADPNFVTGSGGVAAGSRAE